MSLRDSDFGELKTCGWFVAMAGMEQWLLRSRVCVDEGWHEMN
jgi:hypothetical protein